MNKINEKIKQCDFFDSFILTEMLTVVLICLAQLFRLGTAVSLLHDLTYAVLFVYFIFRMYRMVLLRQKPDIEFYMLIVFALISFAALMISNYSTKNSIIPDFSFLRVFIFTNSTLLSMYLASNSKVSVKIFKYIVFAVSIVILIFCASYLFIKEYAFYFNGEVSRYLTFGFSNPNLTGFVLCMFFVTMIFGIFITHNRIFKTIYSVFAAVLVFFIYKTLSRNACIVMCFFVFAVAFVLVSKKIKIPNFIWICVCLIPIIFSTVYLSIIESDTLGKIFSFLVSEGKNLDSRENVWLNTIEWIKTSPIFGSYYETTVSLLSPRPHNSHLYIMSAYGLISYIPFVFINCFTFVKANRGECNRLKLCAMIAVASSLMFGMAENTVFSGSAGMFMFITLFIALIPAMKEAPELKGYRLKIAVERIK